MKTKKNSSKDKSEEIYEGLLQRITKQYFPSEQQQHALTFLMERPPDEAASALGHQLALSFQKLNDNHKDLQERTLVTLTSPRMNPSITVSFLQTLLKQTKKMEFLVSWILQTERACKEADDDTQMTLQLDALTTMIRCHAQYIAAQNTNSKEQQEEIMYVYQKLSLTSSKLAMLREFTKQAFRQDNHMTHVRSMLSPLIATCVFNSSEDNQLTILFLEAIWREAWTGMATVVDEYPENVLNVVLWLTNALDIYLLSLQSLNQKIACKEIASRWLTQLLEMASYLVQCLEPKLMRRLGQWLETTVALTLPRLYFTVPTFRIPLESMLIQVQFIVERLNHFSEKHKFSLSPTATHRFATLLLTNPIQEDVKQLIMILTSSVEICRDDFSLAMLKGIASIFGRSETVRVTSSTLMHALKQHSAGRITNRSPQTMNSSVLELLDAPTYKKDEVLHFLSGQMETPLELSAAQQMGALLLGIALLGETQHMKHVKVYWKQLLSQYPHLGVSLLPIMIESMQSSSVKGDGETLLNTFNFMCDIIVQDAQCAREVWNLLGVDLLKPSVPATVRASVIRLFPQICAANKRLYKRIMVALGNSLSIAKDDEIRLAIAATIADLTREDRVRDVADVIGWIQGFLVDSGWVRSVSTLDKEKSVSNAALVHYAILSLHHLVEAEELDYAVVMVVLKKRLCDVHDMAQVTQLPPIVLETLVLLLGDGESEDDDDSEDSAPQQVGVSPQVRQSVQTLINLSLQVNPNNGDNAVRQIALLRCRRNIYISLSKYSMEALGVDAEGMQAVSSAVNNPDAPSGPESGVRYNSIKRVIQEGIQFLLENGDAPFLGNDDDDEEKGIVDSLAALISKIIQFEEETFGSSLWQKRGKAKKSQKKTAKNAETYYADSLPSIATIQQVYDKNQTTATALSALMCFQGKTLSQFSSLVEHISLQSSDPLVCSLSVQAWLNAARYILQDLVAAQSSSEGLERILSEIRDWRFRMEDTDNMNLALSIFALYIPEILGPYGDHSAYVEDLCEEVWKAYKEHEFENSDVTRLCISFLGVSYVRSRNMAKLDEIIGALEKSAMGYGGKATFGACFGLSVIAQAFPNKVDTNDADLNSSSDLGFTRRIVGFLLNQLLSCIKIKHKALSSLVVCVENGTISPEVIDALSALKKTPLELIESKRVIAKTIFISFALCLPALAAVNDELLLGVYCMLDCFPWGSGKGFALPAVLRTCRRCDLFETAEIEKIYSNYAKIFEEGMEGKMEGLEDIFYAVTGTMTRVIPYSIRRFLVGNSKLFDEEGRCISLLCAIASICSFPCLGHGAVLFTDVPHLSPGVSKDDASGVSSLIVEAVGDSAHDLNKYSVAAFLFMGYLASMKSTAHLSDVSVNPSSKVSKESNDISHLPEPQQGTVLEILMPALTRHYDEADTTANEASKVVAKLLACLEVLSLPGNFSVFFEYLLKGDGQMKSASSKLLVSQMSGRPRAVFNGREFIDLVLRLTKSPSGSLRSIFGQAEIPVLLESFGAILPKFPSDKAEESIENVWRLCIKEVNHFPGWTLSFLSSMKMLLSSVGDKKRSNVSPKILKTVQFFLLRKVFSGIRDATWTTKSASTERKVVDVYASCLAEIPIASLVEAEFFSLTDHDGFIGEALRYRCILTLVHVGYFPTSARASSEIQSAMSWFSRQLVSSEDEIFSTTLLNVCCSIAEATLVENATNQRYLLLSLLDNLMLVGSFASTIGLQMVAALLCQWCKGRGSDGDLSMAYLCTTKMVKWQQLSPPALQKMFMICVHDLPFNLAAYSKKEKMGDVIFNRLWRVYNKWQELGVDNDSLECLRKALVSCRSEDSGGDDFASLATSMLLQE